MASTCKIITDGTVQRILKYKDLIPAIEAGLKDFSLGNIVQPVRTTLNVQPHQGYFLTMPAYSTTEDILAMKCVSMYPHNSEKNLPSHQTHILCYEAYTGSLLALMDANTITAMRTAAASVVATKYLAKEDSKILAILGAGCQASSHILALTSLFRYDQILIWNRSQKSATKLCEELASAASVIRSCNTVEEAVSNADVIVTATMSTIPVLSGKFLKKGVHINCVGACNSEWRELDDECMNLCDVYVDSRAGAQVESGDIIKSKKQISGEIGEIVAGLIEADRNRSTIFKSLGMAIEDAVSAHLVCDKLELIKHSTTNTDTKSMKPSNQ